jgi:hypothetical protein
MYWQGEYRLYDQQGRDITAVAAVLPENANVASAELDMVDACRATPGDGTSYMEVSGSVSATIKNSHTDATRQTAPMTKELMYTIFDSMKTPSRTYLSLLS